MRYVPWLLRSCDQGWGVWGVKDTDTGVNVLADFLPTRTGQVMMLCVSEADVKDLIQSGRKREWCPLRKNLVETQR
jgi:hypothetical protein